MVVETHGGHFWASQGSPQRPLDITSLRIDQVPQFTSAKGTCMHVRHACTVLLPCAVSKQHTG